MGTTDGTRRRKIILAFVAGAAFLAVTVLTGALIMRGGDAPEKVHLNGAVGKTRLRSLSLANGVKAVLIQREDIAAHVAGSFSAGFDKDPRGWPGVAHLAEHVQCNNLGAAKDSYSFFEYVHRHMGRIEAVTGPGSTMYLYTVDSTYLKESLGKFRKFLDFPEIDEESALREISAVDSEYWLQAFTTELRVKNIVEECMGSTNLRTNSFGTKETLDRPGIFQAVKAFIRRHYVAEKLTVYVIGPQPLEDLEEMVRKSFKDFKGEEKSPLQEEEDPQLAGLQGEEAPLAVKEEYLNKLITFNPTIEVDGLYHRSLFVSIPLTKKFSYIGINAALLFPHLFIAKITGAFSLEAKLKAMGYIRGIEAGTSMMGRDLTIMTLRFHLKPKGEQNLARIKQMFLEDLQSLENLFRTTERACFVTLVAGVSDNPVDTLVQTDPCSESFNIESLIDLLVAAQLSGGIEKLSDMRLPKILHSLSPELEKEIAEELEHLFSVAMDGRSTLFLLPESTDSKEALTCRWSASKDLEAIKPERIALPRPVIAAASASQLKLSYAGKMFYRYRPFLQMSSHGAPSLLAVDAEEQGAEATSPAGTDEIVETTLLSSESLEVKKYSVEGEGSALVLTTDSLERPLFSVEAALDFPQIINSPQKEALLIFRLQKITRDLSKAKNGVIVPPGTDVFLFSVGGRMVIYMEGQTFTQAQSLQTLSHILQTSGEEIAITKEEFEDIRTDLVSESFHILEVIAAKDEKVSSIIKNSLLNLYHASANTCHALLHTINDLPYAPTLPPVAAETHLSVDAKNLSSVEPLILLRNNVRESYSLVPKDTAMSPFLENDKGRQVTLHIPIYSPKQRLFCMVSKVDSKTTPTTVLPSIIYVLLFENKFFSRMRREGFGYVSNLSPASYMDRRLLVFFSIGERDELETKNMVYTLIEEFDAMLDTVITEEELRAIIYDIFISQLKLPLGSREAVKKTAAKLDIASIKKEVKRISMHLKNAVNNSYVIGSTDEISPTITVT